VADASARLLKRDNFYSPDSVRESKIEELEERERDLLKREDKVQIRQKALDSMKQSLQREKSLVERKVRLQTLQAEMKGIIGLLDEHFKCPLCVFAYLSSC